MTIIRPRPVVCAYKFVSVRCVCARAANENENEKEKIEREIERERENQSSLLVLPTRTSSFSRVLSNYGDETITASKAGGLGRPAGRAQVNQLVLASFARVSRRDRLKAVDLRVLANFHAHAA